MIVTVPVGTLVRPIIKTLYPNRYKRYCEKDVWPQSQIESIPTTKECKFDTNDDAIVDASGVYITTRLTSAESGEDFIRFKLPPGIIYDGTLIAKVSGVQHNSYDYPEIEFIDVPYDLVLIHYKAPA